jgi:hypothetical protein
MGQRFIDAGFEGDALAAAQPFVRRDDVRRCAIGDASCTAPSRAQASMAMAISGIIGK